MRVSGRRNGSTSYAAFCPAERYGRQYFKTTKPFLGDLVPTVVETMAGAFPELRRQPQQVIALIREEEESFIRTLDRGIKLFGEAAQRAPRMVGTPLAGWTPLPSTTLTAFTSTSPSRWQSRLALQLIAKDSRRR